MRNTIKILGLALLSLSMVFTSCKKDEDDNTPENAELSTGDVSLSRKTAYGEDWIYYSFETKSEVSGVDNSNYKDKDNWDIAFNRYNVRTNGGESGEGMAGAYDAGEVAWADVKEAAETGYIADDTLLIVESFNPDRTPNYMSSTGNDVFKDCFIMGFGATGPTYTPNNHIYVMKTTKGKYAKVWIHSYFNADSESGYINFKYAVNNKGNRTF